MYLFVTHQAWTIGLSMNKSRVFLLPPVPLSSMKPKENSQKSRPMSGYRCMQPIICPPVCGKIGFFALAPKKKLIFVSFFRAKKRPACRITDRALTHFWAGKQFDLQKKNSFLLGEKINLAFLFF